MVRSSRYELSPSCTSLADKVDKLVSFAKGAAWAGGSLLAILVFIAAYFINKINQIDRNVQRLVSTVATAEQIALLSGAMVRLHWEGESDPDVSQILYDLNKDLAGSKAELVSANHPDSSANQDWAKIVKGEVDIEAYPSHAHIGAMALNYQGASTHQVVAPFDAVVVRVGRVTKFNTSEDTPGNETYLEVALEGKTYGVDLWRLTDTFVKEGDLVKRGDMIGEVASTPGDTMLCLTVQVHRKGSIIPLDATPFIGSFVTFTDGSSGH